jgi:hypothetical protein
VSLPFHWSCHKNTLKQDIKSEASLNDPSFLFLMAGKQLLNILAENEMSLEEREEKKL